MIKLSNISIHSSCVLFSSFTVAIPAVAQVTTDGTTSTTVISPDGNNFIIDGGDRPDGGSHLFHSFSDFSVPTGGSASFNNALDIVNIFSRVTGGNISNIDGLLRANGTANLFLINPAGIIFGRNAILNIGGSFLGSTADSLLFQDGTEFVATDGRNKPTLTINAPIGLGFRDEPGDIVNQSFALQVSPGRTLALIGGNLSFNGGLLTALGGKLELGSVLSQSEVTLAQTPQGFVMGYEGVPDFGDIQLNQQAVLNTSGLGGGTINIRGEQVSIQDGSQIVSLTQGDFNGGDINIDTGKLLMSNEARISTATFGSGKGGNINIDATDSIEIIGTGFDEFQNTFIRDVLLGNATPESLQQGTGIVVSTFGIGEAGNTIIDTSSLRMSNGGIIFGVTSTVGKGGDIKLNASESIKLIGSALLNGSLLGSTAVAGDIVVEAKNLDIRDGGLIVNATFGSGNGGDIEVNVAETIELFNTPLEALVPTGILANSSLGIGQAGDVKINANNLFADRGAVINNNSGALILNQPSSGNVRPLPGGNAGSIEVNVSNLIELIGIGSNGITTSGISSTAFGGSFSAGDINISTGNLVVRDGARIDAATTGSGQGGTVSIAARESIMVSGTSPIREPALINEIPSAIAATSGRIDLPIQATGKAGNLNIETRQLTIQNEARIAVNSLSLGEAGNLTVMAESINFKNRGSINASTVSGQGGNITLQVDNIINLQNNSLISARATNNANGGNVTIETDFIIASPQQNNDIIARAEQGIGGNINITAEGIFGLEERNSTPPNNTNDIDASSEFGLDGTVLINTPDVGVFQEVIEAPEIVQIQTLGANACHKREIAEASSFIITGKGGTFPQPTAPLSSEAIVIEGKFVPIGTEQRQQKQIQPLVTAQGEIYPARGIRFLENGDIVLTAYPTHNVQRTPHSSPNCQV